MALSMQRDLYNLSDYGVAEEDYVTNMTPGGLIDAHNITEEDDQWDEEADGSIMERDYVGNVSMPRHFLDVTSPELDQRWDEVRGNYSNSNYLPNESLPGEIHNVSSPHQDQRWAQESRGNYADQDYVHNTSKPALVNDESADEQDQRWAQESRGNYADQDYLHNISKPALVTDENDNEVFGSATFPSLNVSMDFDKMGNIIKVSPLRSDQTTSQISPERDPARSRQTSQIMAWDIASPQHSRARSQPAKPKLSARPKPYVASVMQPHSGVPRVPRWSPTVDVARDKEPLQRAARAGSAPRSKPETPARSNTKLAVPSVVRPRSGVPRVRTRLGAGTVSPQPDCSTGRTPCRASTPGGMREDFDPRQISIKPIMGTSQLANITDSFGSSNPSYRQHSPDFERSERMDNNSRKGINKIQWIEGSLEDTPVESLNLDSDMSSSHHSPVSHHSPPGLSQTRNAGSRSPKPRSASPTKYQKQLQTYLNATPTSSDEEFYRTFIDDDDPIAAENQSLPAKISGHNNSKPTRMFDLEPTDSRNSNYLGASSFGRSPSPPQPPRDRNTTYSASDNSNRSSSPLQPPRDRNTTYSASDNSNRSPSPPRPPRGRNDTYNAPGDSSRPSAPAQAHHTSGISKTPVHRGRSHRPPRRFIPLDATPVSNFTLTDLGESSKDPDLSASLPYYSARSNMSDSLPYYSVRSSAENEDDYTRWFTEADYAPIRPPTSGPVRTRSSTPIRGQARNMDSSTEDLLELSLIDHEPPLF